MGSVADELNGTSRRGQAQPGAVYPFPTNLAAPAPEAFGNNGTGSPAAIYLRVSTDTQTTENQEPECLQSAKERGWPIVCTYREQQSAIKKRPVFDGMMADAHAGRFKHLIVWRLDRFGRRMQGNINDVLELDRTGVDVVSVKEPWLAAGGPARNLLLAIFSWLAEEERRILVERVKAGMERARRSGKIFGRPAVPPAKIAAAVQQVLSGVPLREAARAQGMGHVLLRKHVTLGAAERVRAGVSVREVCRQYRLGLNSLRRVLAGTSYLNHYPCHVPCNSPNVHETFFKFEEARDYAHSLRLKSKRDWVAWCASDRYILCMPPWPQFFYRENWRGWSDWLNYRVRLPFAEARAFVRSQQLESLAEWRRWCWGGRRPRNIPCQPNLAYPGEFMGFPDWCGYEPRTCRGKMMVFTEAREHVRSLGLKTSQQYKQWTKTPGRPRRIASSPDRTYAADWKGWLDWLGLPSRKKLPFLRARKEARKLGLHTRKEWDAWARSGLRPSNIPAKPDYAYQRYFRGMPDWLGVQEFRWLPFYKARAYARRLQLRSSDTWWKWSKSLARPVGIPTNPRNAYRAQWRGWADWLGRSHSETRAERLGAGK